MMKALPVAGIRPALIKIKSLMFALNADLRLVSTQSLRQRLRWSTDFQYAFSR